MRSVHWSTQATAVTLVQRQMAMRPLWRRSNAEEGHRHWASGVFGRAHTYIFWKKRRPAAPSPCYYPLLPTPLRLGGPRAREPESPRALRGADEGREPPNSVRAVASTSPACATSPARPLRPAQTCRCACGGCRNQAHAPRQRSCCRGTSHAPRAPQQSRTTSRARGPASRRTRRPQAASASDALHGRCWWPRLRHVAAQRPTPSERSEATTSIKTIVLPVVIA